MTEITSTDNEGSNGVGSFIGYISRQQTKRDQIGTKSIILTSMVSIISRYNVN